MGLLVTRIVLIGVATAIGAKLAASPTSIPIMLAITLGVQMLVERHREGGWNTHRTLSKSAAKCSASTDLAVL